MIERLTATVTPPTHSLWRHVGAVALAYLAGMLLAGCAWYGLNPEPPFMSRHWADPTLVPQSLVLGLALQRRWPPPIIIALGLGIPLVWFSRVLAGELGAFLPWASATGRGAQMIVYETVAAWSIHLVPPALASTAFALRSSRKHHDQRTRTAGD